MGRNTYQNGDSTAHTNSGYYKHWTQALQFGISPNSNNYITNNSNGSFIAHGGVPPNTDPHTQTPHTHWETLV